MNPMCLLALYLHLFLFTDKGSLPEGSNSQQLSQDEDSTIASDISLQVDKYLLHCTITLTMVNLLSYQLVSRLITIAYKQSNIHGFQTHGYRLSNTLNHVL
jgi:hypothetical protein